MGEFRQTTGKARVADIPTINKTAFLMVKEIRAKAKVSTNHIKKGKAKDNAKAQADATNTKHHVLIAKRMGMKSENAANVSIYDEKQGTLKKEQTNNSQHLQPLEVEEETALMFRNHATFSLPMIPMKNPHRNLTTKRQMEKSQFMTYGPVPPYLPLPTPHLTTPIHCINPTHSKPHTWPKSFTISTIYHQVT
jgi:hypothetical protein